MINLLPSSYKQELRHIKKMTVILSLELIFGFFLVSFVLGLVAIWAYLNGEYRFQKALADNLSLELSRAEKIELQKQVLNLNNDLTFINSLMLNKKNLPLAIKTLSRLLTDDFKVELLSYEKISGAISLSGKVTDREKLLELKSALESEPIFAKVDFPPSNWVKSRNIDFFIKVELK